MDNDLFLDTIFNIHPDISDTLEVFLYTNLSAIISPTASALLTPAFQAGLLISLNDVGIRHNIGLPKDLKDILDVFIIANINIINPEDNNST